jgi:hypothetical protein
MVLVSMSLDNRTKPSYGANCIKSRADALANLPNRARWSPAREMRPVGNETVAR